LQPRSLLAAIAGVIVAASLAAASRSLAVEQPLDVPTWLRAHVGEGEGQIAPVVLARARALYLQKVSEGAVKNPCYFAMDATRPNDPGKSGGRFYVICEAERSFRAIAAGHGSGRNLPAAANFSKRAGASPRWVGRRKLQPGGRWQRVVPVIKRADETSDAPLSTVADPRACKPGSSKYRRGPTFPG
jgi:hypothetical protein